jgi:uncharacterized hydrophobic protein (TIGR00341 family)
MALRLVEVVLPVGTEGKVQELLKSQHVDILPSIGLSQNQMLIRLILEAEEAEVIIDMLTKAFSILDGFRLNIVALEATIPEHRPKEDSKKTNEKEEASVDAEQIVPPPPTTPPPSVSVMEAKHPSEEYLPSSKDEKPKEEDKAEKKPKRSRSRISSEELYSGLNDSVKLNFTYLVLVALSVGVAAVGLVQNSVAIIIGAMVIAPLLSPNMALSLATTLANGKLAKKALEALGIGVLMALALSYFLGVLLNVDPTLSEIASRTTVSFGDVAVALAAGAAAAIFVSLGTGAALVGVAVAVALLPPLVVTGLLFGAGEFELAMQSLLLLLCNLIGINLAGTMVFVAEGVWPRSWWEERKAKRAAIIALLVWTMLLMVLILLLLMGQGDLKF